MLTPCNVPDPDMEKCGDNIDNNCDGGTDESGSPGCTLTVSGQIVPGEAGDWYSFKASNTPGGVPPNP